MNKSQLKQRLVGAIVLVALGVIFIPMILDRDDDFGISGSNIPEKPTHLEQLPGTRIPEPIPGPSTSKSAASPVDEQTPEPSPPTSKSEQVATESAPDKSETTTTTAGTSDSKTANSRAWVVQVASFSERDKALKLRDRLRKAKYPTFVESVAIRSGTLYRVRGGPVEHRDHADEWRKKIARDLKLRDALVMVHP